MHKCTFICLIYIVNIVILYFIRSKQMFETQKYPGSGFLNVTAPAPQHCMKCSGLKINSFKTVIPFFAHFYFWTKLLCIKVLWKRFNKVIDVVKGFIEYAGWHLNVDNVFTKAYIINVLFLQRIHYKKFMVEKIAGGLIFRQLCAHLQFQKVFF